MPSTRVREQSLCRPIVWFSNGVQKGVKVDVVCGCWHARVVCWDRHGTRQLRRPRCLCPIVAVSARDAPREHRSVAPVRHGRTRRIHEGKARLIDYFSGGCREGDIRAMTPGAFPQAGRRVANPAIALPSSMLELVRITSVRHLSSTSQERLRDYMSRPALNRDERLELRTTKEEKRLLAAAAAGRD